MTASGETLRLATPWALAGLLLVPPVLFWIWRRARLPRLTFSDTRIMAGLKPGWRVRLRAVPLVLRVMALVLLLLALARPQMENRWQEVLSEGVDVVIALDQSGSMAAVDLGRKPDGGFDPVSRLDYAQQVIEAFIDGRQADRIGLVVFAGRAFTRCPLTLDYGLLNQILTSIEITRRYDGTAIGMGLATSVNRLKDSEARSKVVILVTDGRNNAGEIDPETAARLARPPVRLTPRRRPAWPGPWASRCTRWESEPRAWRLSRWMTRCSARAMSTSRSTWTRRPCAALPT